MISNILTILKEDEYKDISERVEIAKGKYKYPETWKDVFYKIKRHLWQTKKSK